MAGGVRKPKPSPFGPIKLRLPFAAEDRAQIINVRIEGEIAVGWSPQTMAVRATWRPDVAGKLLRIRPIFPGEMRFVAKDPNEIPALADIKVVDGHIDRAYLATLSLRGRIVIQPRSEEQFQQMRALPRIAAYGLPPGFAMYDPILLDPAFLSEAILDPAALLSAKLISKGKIILPGNPRWEALALHGFLSGTYAPALRAMGDQLGADDADHFTMPAIPLDPSPDFTLAISMGTACDPKKKIDGPLDRQTPVPTMQFIRLNRAGLREVIDDRTPDPVVKAMLLDGENAQHDDVDLRQQLMRLGFGDEAGQMPLEGVIREFQIAAKGAIVAIGKPGVAQDQLEKRDFRDLVAARNPLDYSGPISGIINDLTRVALDNWEKSRLRSPLLIVVFQDEQLGPDRIPVIADLWRREEARENSFRMYAADFTRLAPGEALDFTKLEAIGFYAYFPYDKAHPEQYPDKHGGPSTFEPSAKRRVDFAEVTPKRLLGLAEADLLAALAPRDQPLTPTVSTFRVVRAVSEQECKGYLDQINAYDNAGLSFGICHWAMALAVAHPSRPTELGAFAALLRSRAKAGDPGVDVFEPQGMRAIVSGDPGWSSANGALYAPLGFIDGCGNAREMERSGPAEMVPSWRTFYRWVQIGRRHLTIGAACWAMTVERLHSILQVAVKGNDLPVDLRQRAGTPLTIGTVFTSELTVATLLRWHVKSPDGVAKGSNKDVKASKYILQAYINAGKRVSPPSKPNDSAAWQLYIDDWERHLFDELKKQVSLFSTAKKNVHKELYDQFEALADPAWIDQSQEPPVVIEGKNDRAYALDPRLRVLELKGATFALAKSG